jgi:hypothetical protein
MALELPLWLQAGKYSARLDRFFIEEVMRRQNRVFRGLVVTQRAAGANFSVDISDGAAAVKGTSQEFSGMYFLRSTAVENVPVPASPGSGSRTDTVIAVVHDPNSGGTAGDNWIFDIVQGTVIPDNAIGIARLARTQSEPSILQSAITDIAPRGEWSWTVSVNPPTGRGIPGDLWVQC